MSKDSDEWTRVLAEALNNPEGRERGTEMARMKKKQYTISEDQAQWEAEQFVKEETRQYTISVLRRDPGLAGKQIAVNQVDYNWLNFACGLRINCATGEVVIPEDLDLDEAWRQFWEGLARVHPSRPVGFG
jgi:hypothetical protein